MPLAFTGVPAILIILMGAPARCYVWCTARHGRINSNKTSHAISIHHKKGPKKSMPAASCQFQWASLGITGHCGHCRHACPPFYHSILRPIFEGQGWDGKCILGLHSKMPSTKRRWDTPHQHTSDSHFCLAFFPSFFFLFFPSFFSFALAFPVSS